MQRIYIDTNVYYIPHINSHTNSRRVIESATGAKFTIVQSDYLYDEAIALFKRVRKRCCKHAETANVIDSLH